MRTCAPKEQFLLFDKFKAFDNIESSHRLFFFSQKRHVFLYACATCSELISNVSTMVQVVSRRKGREGDFKGRKGGTTGSEGRREGRKGERSYKVGEKEVKITY